MIFSQSDPALRIRTRTSVSTVRIPRDLLSAQIGAYADDERILEPGRATLLCLLPDGEGMLLIARDLSPVVLREVDDEFVDLLTFRESVPQVWVTLHALWPGTRPGSRFSRFWLAHEPPEGGYPGGWGLLDLTRLDVLVRGPRAQMEHLVACANVEPETFLRYLAVSEVTQALRGAEPHTAGAIAEQVWTAWQGRIG